MFLFNVFEAFLFIKTHKISNETHIYTTHPMYFDKLKHSLPNNSHRPTKGDVYKLHTLPKLKHTALHQLTKRISILHHDCKIKKMVL